MNILLDTHTFIWFIEGNSRLSARARQLIEDAQNQPFLSIASLWEMAIKVSLGKLTISQPFEKLIPTQLQRNGIEIMDIGFPHTAVIVNLPLYHRDPFDRLLVAQALIEQMPFVSADVQFDSYGIIRLW